MGFMMMQCGLGLYDLALLHLVAHSLYKAYAFLSTGGAVEQNRLQQMTPPQPPLSALRWLMGAMIGMALVAAAALAWGFSPTNAPALWAVGGILSLALAPLVTRPLHSTDGWWRVTGLVTAFGVALAYFGLHTLFGRWLGAQSTGVEPSMVLVTWVLCCFGLLFAVQGAVRASPQGAFARRLYPWLFAGFYLDEIFTRLTFRLWPARTPTTPGTLNKLSTQTNTRTLGDS
jgi:NAD(P)H-quinone oxidoreductase subunit 5